MHQAHILLCLSQVELELESLKNQQAAAAAADSSSLVTKEEVSILRYLALTHNLLQSPIQSQRHKRFMRIPRVD